MCSLGRHWAAFIGVITAGCFIAFSGRQYRYRDGADAPAWDTNTEFIGAIGVALTVGLRKGGVLLSLLVLPLYIPV